MGRNETTSKVIDEVLRFAVATAAVGSGLIIPNALVALDKPLKHFWRHMDKRERERELRRVIYNLKAQGYLAGEYEHGLQLTEKAKKRLARLDEGELAVKPQKQWDKRWRIILYDIPEEHKSARNSLNFRLRAIGCFQLQKSTWITPFPCRDIVAAACASYDIDSFVTYFEAVNLDNEAPLITRFKKRYPETQF